MTPLERLSAQASPLELREEVVHQHRRKPEVLLKLAKVATADREGLLSPAVPAPHGRFDDWWQTHFLPADRIGPTAHRAAIAVRITQERREKVAPEVERLRAELEAEVERRREQAVRGGDTSGNSYRGAEQVIAEKCRMREGGLLAEIEQRSPAEVEITARMALQPDWEHVERGTWRDAASGATVEGDEFSFGVTVCLEGSDLTLRAAALQHSGPGVCIVVTDRTDVREDERETVESSRVKVVGLGPEYEAELRRRLDALTSPIAVLPLI